MRAARGFVELPRPLARLMFIDEELRPAISSIFSDRGDFQISEKKKSRRAQFRSRMSE
jgi:hypothetical protein